ncbi:MAG: hypothetical protein ACRERR_15515 [Moraxellaceae bacterium]
MKRLLMMAPVLGLLLAGCSSTQVEQVTSEKPEAAALSKVLVVGINTSPEIQKTMEEAFSKRLASSKRTVVLASDWFPGEKQPTREQIAVRAKAEGVTGVLVTRLINYEVTDVKENYPEFSFSLAAPSRSPNSRVGWEMDPWVQGFNNAQEIRENAPLVERKAVVETRLYNTESGQVMWQAQTKTLLERDASRNFDGFVSAIMAQLRKSGWL